MKTILLFTLSLLLSLSVSDVCAQERVYDISQFGLKANSKKNASPVVRKAIAKIKAECRNGEEVVLRFPAGRYNFMKTVRMYANIIYPITIRTIPKRWALPWRI